MVSDNLLILSSPSLKQYSIADLEDTAEFVIDHQEHNPVPDASEVSTPSFCGSPPPPVLCPLTLHTLTFTFPRIKKRLVCALVCAVPLLFPLSLLCMQCVCLHSISHDFV